MSLAAQGSGFLKQVAVLVVPLDRIIPSIWFPLAIATAAWVVI
jgi:hypothetical protein